MITVEENSLNVDLRIISHAKSMKDLWEDDTEAFKFGINYPKVVRYINNINLKKKNPAFYNEFNSINLDTIDYIEPMFELVDDYVDDGEESLLGVINHIHDNLDYAQDIDKTKMAFILGIYVISGELQRVLQAKLSAKVNLSEN